MKLFTVIGLCALTGVLGGGAVWLADKAYWDAELKRQLADRDRMIQELNTGITQMKTDLGALEEKNSTRRQTLLDSYAKANDIIGRSATAIDKLRAAVTGLGELKKVLVTWEAEK